MDVVELAPGHKRVDDSQRQARGGCKNRQSHEPTGHVAGLCRLVPSGPRPGERAHEPIADPKVGEAELIVIHSPKRSVPR